MQPSDYFSASGPGVIFMRNFEEPERMERPEVRFEANPNIFMYEPPH